MILFCPHALDTPTAKFGEALRAQVEERLNFFETGAPPGKNADAIRKVLEDLALEEEDRAEDVDMADVDTELALTTLEPSPKKEKKKKKRNSDAMDVDDEEEEHTSKKVKLSKEEKKALKKAKKDKAKKVPAADGDSVSYPFVVCLAGTDCGVHRTMRFLRKRKRKGRKRRKKRN